MRLVLGRSTPAIRAIVSYPCRCLCFWFEQITRTTPRRRTILHLSQIRFTDALTFISVPVHVQRRTSNFPHDPSPPDIGRRELQPHPIADQEPHEVAIHPIRDVRHHERPFVEPHLVEGARQGLHDPVSYTHL